MVLKKKNSSNSNRTLGYAINGKKSKSEQFNLGEVYRHIRTNIDFSNVTNTIKVINLTSTQPSEGKTTTAINMAFAYAGIHEKVLLIDCDLRKPQIHKYFKVSNKFGLTNLVLEYAQNKVFEAPSLEMITDKTFKGYLSVIAAGSQVPNPAEFIESDNFKEYINHIKEYYDFIIIDCPPIGAVSDAVPLSGQCDGTIFIYSTKDTDKKEAKLAIENLKRNRVNILGTIMTKVDADRNGKYGYYSYEEYR